MPISRQSLGEFVQSVVHRTRVTDIHTHLFAPEFGDLMLAGIDELLNYHYLIAEMFRVSPISYDEFWSKSREQQADLIWQSLFIERTPLSEACRGVITVLNKFGMSLKAKDLSLYRQKFSEIPQHEYIDRVFSLAGVASVVMTNDPFDSLERKVWLAGEKFDGRFHAALRIDALLNGFTDASVHLREWGYQVEETLGLGSIEEIQRFLNEWMERMKPLYMAVSLPSDFRLQDDVRTKLIKEAVLPVCRKWNIPFAMMIGVKRAVNQELQSAGDSLGKSEIGTVEELCRTFPGNKFMVTMLSRENQHELAVTARKFRNLMVFGCWWFLNNPSLITEITRMRLELLGASVIPQHSDARILDQLVYKWAHSRKIIADVLTDKYADMMDAGWILEPSDIENDVNQMFHQNFWDFIDRKFV